jgi:hypothetical protein
MFCSSPEPSIVSNGRRKMILLIFAALGAKVNSFCPQNGSCRDKLRLPFAPRIREVLPSFSLVGSSRRRSFLLFGKSTAFVSKEHNDTGVTPFEKEIHNISLGGRHLNITDCTTSAGPPSLLPYDRRIFSISPPNIPLNDLQLVSLRNRIPKFTIPMESVSGGGRPSRRFVVLWRSLLDDSPDLAGFPIPFLAEQAQSMDAAQILLANETSPTILREAIDDNIVDWERVLPYIDAYQFESGGGLSGLVYGIAGVSDGTRIRTTPVGDVQTTLPRNFVKTADGCFYELGKPSFVDEKDMKYDSLRGASKRWYRDGSEVATSMLSKTAIADNLSSSIVDTEILQLSALTALVLGGSYVLGTLSHHLTVNVFWV